MLVGLGKAQTPRDDAYRASPDRIISAISRHRWRTPA